MKNLKKCVSMLLACLLAGSSAAALSGCDVQDILNGLQGTMSSSDVLDVSSSGGTSDGSSDSGTTDGEFSVGLSYKLASELDWFGEVEEDCYVVTGMGTCTDTCVVIPSEYNGLPVKMVYGLLDNYFVECLNKAGMTEEEINEELEEEGMTLTSVAIEKLVIPDSVMAIYFICLDDLKELYIGKGVSVINTLCIKNLQTLVVDEENENYSAVGANLYSKDGKTLCVSFNGQIADGTEIIESRAFAMSNIESITIPDSVTSIGDEAFAWCSSLTSVTIGNGVTDIGGWAFGWCSNLTSVVIGNGVTSIGSYAFYGCTNLQYNEYDNAKYLGNENNPYLALIEETSVFITSCTIHNNTKIIADEAFYDDRFEEYSRLTSVVIPDSVTHIGEKAFYYSLLTSVTIGNGVTHIGEEAFSACRWLTSIEVSENNSTYKSIDGNLYSKDGTTLIQYAIGKTATSFTIPDSVTEIGSSAFKYCSSLTSVVIPDSVTSIGDEAFAWYSSLQDIYISDIAAWCNIDGLNYLMSYGSSNKNLYLNNELVTELVIPDTVTSIPSYAFNCCSSLTSVVIPDSVTGIGDYAFKNCSSLTSIEVSENNSTYKSIDGNLYTKDGKTLIQYAIGKTATLFTIPNSVTSIGEDAFKNCSSLTSVEIPDSVTSIGYCAFYKCSSLSSVTIGNGVTSIGDYAFKYCSSLTSVVIPNSVTSIGEDAFNCCSSLTSVIIGNGVTSIGDSAFSWCSSLTSIEVSENNSTYKSIDGNLYSKNGTTLIQYAIGKTATSFTIPDSVTCIGYSAFDLCSSLTSITFNGTKAQWNAIEKSYNWKYCSALETVVCTDGTIDLD